SGRGSAPTWRAARGRGRPRRSRCRRPALPSWSLLPAAPHLGAQPRRRLPVYREVEPLERAGQHDAVVLARALRRDVLVEDVVTHLRRVAVERVAPASTAAVVIGERLARLVRHEAGRVPRLLARAAHLELEPVRRARLAARDAGHRVLPADDVGVDGGGRGQLLSVERPEAAAELAR